MATICELLLLNENKIPPCSKYAIETEFSIINLI